MPWVTINGNHVLIGEELPKGVKDTRPISGDMSQEEVNRIAAKSQRIATLPTIRSAKGEEISVSVSTNPFHGVLHRAEGTKPFYMETHVNGELNDTQQFSKFEKAIERAKAWHKTISQEEAQQLAKRTRGKKQISRSIKEQSPATTRAIEHAKAAQTGTRQKIYKKGPK